MSALPCAASARVRRFAGAGYGRSTPALPPALPPACEARRQGDGMPHIPMRVRAVLTTAAVVVSVAACGSGAPDPAAPVTGPDLYASLPPNAEPPTAAPLPPPTVAPPSTTTKPSAKPKAEGKPKAAASAGPGAGWKQVGGD